MAADLEDAFARHYRGRHRPEDAWFWLDHPDVPGPSGARPAQESLLLAARQLEAGGEHTMAEAMTTAAFELLSADRRQALDALAHARDCCRR